MVSAKDFPACGRIVETQGGFVVFHPAGTSYQLQLVSSDKSIEAKKGVLVEGLIRCEVRKLWTVPSGGNFISPIFGPPRIIQGRVRQASEEELLVHAGTNFVLALPRDPEAFDLANGAVGAGTLVNVTILPGATFELIGEPVAK